MVQIWYKGQQPQKERQGLQGRQHPAQDQSMVVSTQAPGQANQLISSCACSAFDLMEQDCNGVG